MEKEAAKLLPTSDLTADDNLADGFRFALSSTVRFEAS
jgi:hypothetical protein